MALFAYSNRGETPDASDPAIFMAFSFVRAAMDENEAKYMETQTARAEAGRAGGLAKASKRSKANNSYKTPSKPTLYGSVSGSVSGSDSGSLPPEGGVTSAGTPRFSPPTLAEVSAYVSERHSPVDAQEFIDFYASKGWLVGKTPMKDWKAACRNAEKWDRWKTAGVGKSCNAPAPSAPGEADKRVREDMARMRAFMENQEEKHG